MSEKAVKEKLWKSFKKKQNLETYYWKLSKMKQNKSKKKQWVA